MLFGEFAKCQAEAEYPELWQGLVGAWSPCLSPRGGTVLRDLSGRGNHGTLTNMDAATDWVTSGGKTALDFDGSNDYVSIDHNSIFAWPKGATFSTWCRADAFGLRQLWMKWQNPPLIYIGVLCHTDGKLEFQPHLGKSVGTLTVGKLHHIVATYGPAGAHLYIDGVKDGISNTTSITPVAEANVPLWIGADTANSRYWDGQILDHTYTQRQATQNDVSLSFSLGPGGWATPRRRRWNYATAQTAIPYWVFGRKNARLIGGGVS